jgi:Zn-dependent peptidase ImmA (M78 family)/ElaB/YqjD/DUF883 family membrane-anchored ribosome-binding protein
MSSIINIAKTLAANEEKKNKLGGNVDRIASELVNSTAYKEYEVSKYDTDSKSFYDELNTFYKDVNEGAYKQGSDVSAILGKNNQMISATQSAMEYFKGKDDKTYKALESELANLNKIGTDLGEISKYYGNFANEDDYRVTASVYNAPKGSESTVADSIRDVAFGHESAKTAFGLSNIHDIKGHKTITENGITAMTAILAKEGLNVEELLKGVKSSAIDLDDLGYEIGFKLMGYNTEHEANKTIRETLSKYGFTNEEITLFLTEYAYINESKDTNEAYEKLFKKIDDNIHSEAWTDALLSVVSVPASVVGGVLASADLALQNAVQSFDKNYIIGYNTDAQRFTNDSTQIRSSVSEKLGGVGGLLYQTGMSIADSSLAMLASAGIGSALGGASAASGAMNFSSAVKQAPWVSGVLLGSSAGASTAQSFKAMGYTDGEALTMGVLAGAAESVFETLSLEKLFGDTMEKLSKAALSEVGAKRILKQTSAVLMQGLFEGSEELFTEVANGLNEIIVLGIGNTTTDALIRENMAQGMSFHDAHWDAILDKTVDAMLAFVGGAISGGVMGGGATFINNSKVALLKQQYKADYKKGVTALENTLDNIKAMSKLQDKIKHADWTSDKLIDSHIEAVANAMDGATLRTEIAKIGAESEVRETTFAICSVAQTFPAKASGLAKEISKLLGVNVTAEDLAQNRGGIATIYASYLYTKGLTATGRRAAVDKAIKRTQEFLDEQIKKGETSVRGRINYGEVDKKKFDALRKGSVKVINNMANVLDMDVVLFDSAVEGNKKVNGFLDRKNKVIYLDINSGNNAEGVMLFTMAHELVHFIKETNVKNYEVLRDFLIDTYGKSKIEVLIKEQQTKASQYGDNMSPEAALEEVVSDFAARMLASEKVMNDFAKLTNKHKGFAARVKEFFSDTEGKLAEMYGNFEADTPESYELSKLGSSAVDTFRSMFEKAVLDTAVINRTKKKDGTIGTIDLNAYKEAKDSNGDLVFNYKAMMADENTYKKMLKDWGGMSDSEIAKLFDTIDAAMAKIRANLEILDFGYDKDINDRAFFPIKQNSDKLYKVSLDFSTLCRKRILQQTVQRVLQEKLDRNISVDESIKIRDELARIRDEGRQIEIACALCYVESARLKSPAQISSFLANREKILNEYFADKSGTNIKEAVAKAEADVRNKYGIDPKATLKSIDTEIAKEIRVAKKNAKASYVPTAEEQNIIEAAKKMTANDFTSAEGIENLAKNYPDIFRAYTAKIRAATHSKAMETDTWFRAGDTKNPNSPASIGDQLILAMNAENGIRSQSWSDFQVIHLMDYIAAVIELATRGSKMQVYSKVPDYVRLMGKTGAMINMSLIPSAKFNGKLKFDPLEGMPIKEALKLRDKYHGSAGTICIGMNNEQIEMLLESDLIDYVIPYHRSSMSKATRAKMGIPTWEDYESVQSPKKLNRAEAEANAQRFGATLLSEKDEEYHAVPSFGEWFTLDIDKLKDMSDRENKNPTKPELKEKYGVMYGAYMAMQEAGNTYIRLCAERGIAPQFSYGKGDFADNANYWKLIIDRKMIDNVTGEIINQKPIRPIFDKNTVLNILDNEIKRYPSVKADQEYAIKTAVDNLLPLMQDSTIDIEDASDNIADVLEKPINNIAKVNVLSTAYESELAEKDKAYSRKYTPEEARAAIERVKSGEVTEAPKVKNFTMTTGALKKFISEFSKNKRYSKEVAKEITKAFEGVTMLKPEDIRNITELIWEGLNDFSDSGYKKIFAKDMAKFYVSKLIEEQSIINVAPDKITVEMINAVKSGIHKLTFTEENRAELRHLLGDDGFKRFVGRWGNKSKENTTYLVSQFVVDFAREHSDLVGSENLEGMSVEDALVRIDEIYSAALRDSKNKTAVADYLDSEEYENYIANILDNVETSILNAYETKGKDTYYGYIETQLHKEREKMTAINRITRLLDRFEHQSRANKADLVYTDIVNGLKLFKAYQGKNINVDNVKAYAEKLEAFIEKFNSGETFTVSVDGKEEVVTSEAFDIDKAMIDDEAKEIIKALKNIDTSNIGEGERDLTLEEYKMLNDTLGLVARITASFGNEYIDGEWRSNLESVVSVINSSSEAYKKNKHIENVLKSSKRRTLKEQFDTPTDYINFIFGSREENIVNRYVNDIVKAADDMRAEYIKLIRPYEKYLADDKYFNRLYKEEVTICGEKITIGEFISLYCTSKREQAHSGLVGKKTVFGNANEKSTSNLPGRRLRKVMLGNSIKEVKANIEKAYESLNDKDKAFIKLVEEFFNEISTYIKTAADLKYFGYTNAQDESYYFPITREGSGRDIASVYVGAISVVKQSFNHSINKKANGALSISNVFDVLTKHLDGLMQYKHMFVPVQNFSKLFGKNVAEKGQNANTILMMLQHNTGGSTVQYIRDWLANLQGKNTAKRDITTFKSFLATSSLGFNLQSVAKQNASLVAMMSEGTPEVVLSLLEEPIFNVLNKEEMTRYSSVASYRIHDNAPYSAAIGKVSSDMIPKTGLEEFGASFRDKATSFLRWGDQRVTYAMWSACQRIVARKQGLKLNTVENFVAAGKLLDEMINKYNDTTSNALRPLAIREGGWYSVWSMFASQPIKLWSSMMRSAEDIRTAKALGDKAAKKKATSSFLKAESAILLQAVWTTLVTMIFRALMRKGLPKDEDEITAHVIGVTYVTEVLGVMPIIGDIVNVVLKKIAGEYTYDIGGDAMSEYYNNVASLLYTGAQAFQGKGDLAEGNYKKVFELIASVCGVPAKNIYKYSTILTSNVDQILKKTSTYVVDYYYSGYAPTVKDLKNAAKKDSRYAETMLEILASKKLGSKDADSELSSYTIEELLRLYKAELSKGDDGDLGFLLPPSVPKKFSKSEAKTYYATMEKAYSFANNLLDSARYKALDDSQRRDAISSVWSIYNDAAKVSATKSAASVPQAARYMIVTSGEKSAEIYVLANAYEKAYNNASKQERAKMKPVATYLSQLCREYGISNEQRVIIAAALGVGATKDIKNAVKKKAESKGITIITSDNE